MFRLKLADYLLFMGLLFGRASALELTPFLHDVSAAVHLSIPCPVYYSKTHVPEASA